MRTRWAAAVLAVGLVAGVVTVVVPATAQTSVTPTGAAAGANDPKSPLRWLALGDSYSSGEGVDPNFGDCAQSPLAYAQVAHDQLAAEGFPVEEPDFLACSGAQVPDVTESVDLVEQIEQAKGRRYDLITFSIGGNDGGFGDLIRQCLLFTCALSKPLDEVEAEYSRRIDAVQPSLVDIYGRIIDELLASGGHIVVLGYPRLFEASESWPWYVGNGCETLVKPETDMVRRLADHANAMIAEAVANHPDVMRFLDVSDAFEGHNLCAGFSTINEWINGISYGQRYHRRWPRYQHSFHPNRAGHAAEGALLADAIEGLDWSIGPSATITLRYGGLTVDTGTETVAADFGEPLPPGTDLEGAISEALGEPMMSSPAEEALLPDEYRRCGAGRIDRFVLWPSKGLAGAALAVSLAETGGSTELMGYHSYGSSPALEMADGVSVGSSVASLFLAYLFAPGEVAIVDDSLDSGGYAFELRGPSPRGPAYGTFVLSSVESSAYQVIDRGSGDRCGLGSSLDQD